MREATIELNFRDAIKRALQEEMREDRSVVMLGEDIGHAGGPFKVTEGLIEEFGEERIMDTPIAETAISGAALGMAITGLRPVAEIMFADFLAVCMDQIVNSIAKYRYMSGGQVSVPLVIRTACGGGIRFAAQHSQTGESWFMQFPGLQLVCPSNPHDAYHLMKAAIRSPDPVIFFEHKILYARKGMVRLDQPEEIGKCKKIRTGDDVTFVASMAMVEKAVQAAEQLEALGIHAEILDLRSVRPLDHETICESVRKTNHLLTIEEHPAMGGWGSEVIARVIDHAFDYLDAPPMRVSAPDAPLGFSPVLEDAAIPSADRIVNVVRELLRK